MCEGEGTEVAINQARSPPRYGGWRPRPPSPRKAPQAAVPGWRAGAPWGCVGLRWARACQCGFSVLPYQMESGCCLTAPTEHSSLHSGPLPVLRKPSSRHKGPALISSPSDPRPAQEAGSNFCPEQKQVRKSLAGSFRAGRAAGSPGAGAVGVSKSGLPHSAQGSQGLQGLTPPQQLLYTPSPPGLACFL